MPTWTVVHMVYHLFIPFKFQQLYANFIGFIWKIYVNWIVKKGK